MATHLGVGLSPDDSPLTELFNVVLHAPAEAVRDYVLQHGVDVEQANEKGDTALLLAARRGDLGVVEVLLSPPICADVSRRNLKGSNALIAASMKGHADICRLLLQHGADVNQATDSSDTALSLAIWQNHTEVCRLLIDAGANVDNIDKFGDCLAYDTPVALAEGSTVLAQHLAVGQRLVGLDGRACVVQAVDRRRPAKALIRLESEDGSSYAVTPGHRLVLRWNGAPSAAIEYDQQQHWRLLVSWTERLTLQQRWVRFPCVAPLDPENAREEALFCDALEGVGDFDPTIPRWEEQWHPPRDAAIAAPVLADSDSDQSGDVSPFFTDEQTELVLSQRMSCTELRAFAAKWLQTQSGLGRIDPLLPGDLLELKAEQLYAHRKRFLSLDNPSTQLLSGRRVPLPNPRYLAAAAASFACDDLHPLAVPPAQPHSSPCEDANEMCQSLVWTVMDGRYVDASHAPHPPSSSTVLYSFHHSSSSAVASDSDPLVRCHAHPSPTFPDMEPLWQRCGVDQSEGHSVLLHELRPAWRDPAVPSASCSPRCLSSMQSLLGRGVRTIVAFGPQASQCWFEHASSLPCVRSASVQRDSVLGVPRLRFDLLEGGQRVCVFAAPHPCEWRRGTHLLAAIALAHGRKPEFVRDLLRSSHAALDRSILRSITLQSLPSSSSPSYAVDVQVSGGGVFSLGCGTLTHNSMLLDAAKHGNVSVLRLLLDKTSVPIDHQNNRGDSALLRAAWKGDVDALALLLDAGANPAIANKSGCTPLIMACMHNNRACARLLIERDSSPINAVDETGRSAFAYLALYAPGAQGGQGQNNGNGSEEPFWDGMVLLLQRGCRIDTPPNMGNLLLCRAANINHVPLASLLLQAGADINFCDPANKDRPPLLAHLQGVPDLSCTRFLLSNRARVDHADADGHTALMFAVKHCAPDITEVLLEGGASLWLENRAGDNATSMAQHMVSSIQAQMAQLAPFAHATDPDQTPPALAMHQAALERAQKCLQLLLDRSAREMGSGALLLQAASHGEVDRLESLLRDGAPDPDGVVDDSGHMQMQSIDVNFTDRAGRSALMHAARSNHVDAVRLLLEQGALLHLRDKDGLTALTHAIRSNARDAAELLAETVQGHALARGIFASAPAPRGGVAGPAPAQRELEAQTAFLRKVADSLRQLMQHGAAADGAASASATGGSASLALSPTDGDGATRSKALSLSSGGGGSGATSLNNSVGSPLAVHLTSPLASLPRSSSYLTSFPSPTGSAPQSAARAAVSLEPLSMSAPALSPKGAGVGSASGSASGGASTPAGATTPVPTAPLPSSSLLPPGLQAAQAAFRNAGLSATLQLQPLHSDPHPSPPPAASSDSLGMMIGLSPFPQMSPTSSGVLDPSVYFTPLQAPQQE